MYCRVSSKHEDQEYSPENQIAHSKETIGEDPRYELVEIYYDFGISGFKAARPGFQKMLEESRNGKFELVITKSITRFARNTGSFWMPQDFSRSAASGCTLSFRGSIRSDKAASFS